MSKFFKYNKIICALSFFLLTFTLNANSSKEAWKVWRKGFSTFEKGEDQYLMGKYEDSLANFQTAQDYFSSIKTKFPDWKIKLTNYRIDLCKRKIKNVNKRIASKARNSGGLSSMSSTVAHAVKSTKLEQLQIELDRYRNKFYTASASLEITKRDLQRNNKSAEQVVSLIKENDELALQIAQLKKKLESSFSKDGSNNGSFDTDEFNELNHEIAKLAVSNKILKAELDVTKKSNSESKTKSDMLTAEMGRIAKKLKSLSPLQNKNKYLESNVIKLKSTIEKLKADAKSKESYGERIDTVVLEKTEMIQQLRNELDQIREKSDVANLTEQLRESNKKLSEKNDALMEAVTSISKEKDEIRKKFSKSIANIIELGSTIELLKEKFNELQEEYAANAKNRNFDSEYVEQRSSVIAGLKKENNTMRKELISLLQSFTTIKSAAKELSAEIENDKSAFLEKEQAYKNELEFLKNKNEILAERAGDDSAKADILAKLKEINDLSRKLETKNKKLESYEDKISRFEEVELQYVKLKEKIKDESLNPTSANIEASKLQNVIQTLNAEVVELQKKNSELTAQATQDSGSAILQEKIKETDEVKNQLSLEVMENGKLKEKIVQIELQIERLTAKNDELDLKISNSKSPEFDIAKELSQTDAQKQIRKLTEKYEAKASESDQKVKSLASSLRRSKNMSKVYKDNLSNLQLRFSSLEETMKRSADKIKIAESFDAQLMQKKLEFSQQEVIKLNNVLKSVDIEGLIENNSELKIKNDLVSDKNIELEEKIAALEKIKLRPDVQVLVDWINRKDKAIDALIEQIEDVKVDNEGLTETFEDMERKLYKRDEKIMQYREWLEIKSKNFDALADIKKNLELKLNELKQTEN